MFTLLSILVLALPGQVPTTTSSEPAAPPARSLALQESILPVRTVSAGLSLGVVGAGTPASQGVPFILEPGGAVTLDWSPLDWLQVSFLRPGLSVLVGTRGRDEVVLSGGLEGIGYHRVEGLLLQPGVRAAWRHWHASTTSVALVAGWSSLLSLLSTSYSLDGAALATHTLGDVLSFNVAVGALGWPSQSLGFTVGSGRIGLRTLPLVRLHVTPVWALDLDAQVRFQVQPVVASVLQVFVGVSAAW